MFWDAGANNQTKIAQTVYPYLAAAPTPTGPTQALSPTQILSPTPTPTQSNGVVNSILPLLYLIILTLLIT